MAILCSLPNLVNPSPVIIGSRKETGGLRFLTQRPTQPQLSNGLFWSWQDFGTALAK